MKQSNCANYHKTTPTASYHKGGYSRWKREPKSRTGSADFKESSFHFKSTLAPSGRPRRNDDFENCQFGYQNGNGRQVNRNGNGQNYLRPYKTQQHLHPWRTSNIVPVPYRLQNPNNGPVSQVPSIPTTTFSNYFRQKRYYQQSRGQFQNSCQNEFSYNGYVAPCQQSIHHYDDEPLQDPTTAVMAAMGCALAGRDQIQEMLMRQFNEQLTFENTITSEVQEQQQWPWFGEDDISSPNINEDIPFDVVETIETESIGNSVDRFIKNGYNDSQIDDEDYLSDHSLKNFLKCLGHSNFEKDDLNTDPDLGQAPDQKLIQEQDITFQGADEGDEIQQRGGGLLLQSQPIQQPPPVRSFEDIQKVKDNINLSNFFKSQSKACQSCNKRFVNGNDSSYLSQNSQNAKDLKTCSTCKRIEKQNLNQSLTTLNLNENDSQSFEKVNHPQSGHDQLNGQTDGLGQTMFSQSIQTLNNRIERLTRSSYGVGVNRKKQKQNACQKTFKQQ